MNDEEFLDWCSLQTTLKDWAVQRLVQLERQFDRNAVRYHYQESVQVTKCMLAKPENIPQYVTFIRDLITADVRRRLLW